jgi:hypothetical protein
VDELHGALVDIPCRESSERLFDCDPGLEPSQRGTEAEMRSVTEADVTYAGSMDIEDVCVRILTLVTAG